jgi:Zn-dependent M28 family amino/carboxypeptidase
MSSVGCLLTLIEEIAYQKIELKTHLEICFWDMEEVGKKGSEFYVKNLDKTVNYVAIVLEMIGWRCKKPFSQRVPFWTMFIYPSFYVVSLLNLNRADFHLVIGRQNDLNKIMKFAPSFPNCQTITAFADLSLSSYLGLCDSDHHNFWICNVPAILLTDTGKYRSQLYHTPEDTFAHIDIDFVLDVLRWLIKLVTVQDY